MSAFLQSFFVCKHKRRSAVQYSLVVWLLPSAFLSGDFIQSFVGASGTVAPRPSCSRLVVSFFFVWLPASEQPLVKEPPRCVTETLAVVAISKILYYIAGDVGLFDLLPFNQILKRQECLFHWLLFWQRCHCEICLRAWVRKLIIWVRLAGAPRVCSEWRHLSSSE